MTKEIVQDILEKTPRRISLGLRLGLVFLTLVGVGLLAGGILIRKSTWSVEALLVASLVTGGLGQAGVVWSAVFEMTHARWARSYRRILELCIAFVPVSLVGLLVLFVLSPWWAPFASDHLEGAKAVWLSIPFWAVRNFVGLLGVFILSGVYLYYCFRPDVGLARERGAGFQGWLAERLIQNWKGSDVEVEKSVRMRARLSPVLCLAYVWVYSMVGFDLVMALDKHWYSTLFGAYFMTGNLYMGLAVGLVLACVLRGRIGPDRFFSPKHFGLMGTLLFAFCFLMGDFFWSQFLTIYYGNLPEETEYLLLRTCDPQLPWYLLAWTVLVGFFGIPFIALMFRAVKWVAGRVTMISIVVIAAMLMERFLTTGPPILKLQPGASLEEMLLPLGVTLGATLGLLSAGALLYVWIMKQVPMLPISDPYLADSLKDAEERR